MAYFNEGEVERLNSGVEATLYRREGEKEILIPYRDELKAARSGASLLLGYEVAAMELRSWSQPKEYWWDPISIRVYARIISIQQVNGTRWHVEAEAIEGLPKTGRFEVDLIRRYGKFMTAKSTPFPIE